MPDTDIARLTDRFMRQIQSRLNRAAPQFDRFNVGPGGGMMLMTLAEIAPARLHQLVEQMARDKSQITRQVKVLEGKGLIARAADPDDARGWILSLTPLGQTFVAELEQAVADALSQVLSPLSPHDTETLRSLLARL